MDAAIALMSNLSLAARAEFERKFENIELHAFAVSSDFARRLSRRMPTASLPTRIMVTSKYLDYRSQAQKLDLEASEWDLKYAWHMHDWATRQLPGSFPASVTISLSTQNSKKHGILR
jgi:hypothetical protein